MVVKYNDIIYAVKWFRKWSNQLKQQQQQQQQCNTNSPVRFTKLCWLALLFLPHFFLALLNMLLITLFIFLTSVDNIHCSNRCGLLPVPRISWRQADRCQLGIATHWGRRHYGCSACFSVDVVVRFFGLLLHIILLYGHKKWVVTTGMRRQSILLCDITFFHLCVNVRDKVDSIGVGRLVLLCDIALYYVCLCEYKRWMSQYKDQKTE